MKYFKPLWSEDDVRFSNPGLRDEPTFVIHYPESGGVTLKQTGTKPTFDIIQSNLANCDLVNVIEAVAHPNQFNVVDEDTLNTMVVDFTGFSNISDLYNSSKRLEYTWSDLPLEVRSEFDSDIKKFIRSIGTDDFNEKVSRGYNKFTNTINSNNLVNNNNVVVNEPIIGEKLEVKGDIE